MRRRDPETIEPDITKSIMGIRQSGIDRAADGQPVLWPIVVRVQVLYRRLFTIWQARDKDTAAFLRHLVQIPGSCWDPRRGLSARTDAILSCQQYFRTRPIRPGKGS